MIPLVTFISLGNSMVAVVTANGYAVFSTPLEAREYAQRGVFPQPKQVDGKVTYITKKRGK